MRPRVIPAENLREHGRLLSQLRRFNEAAGNPRGKPVVAWVDDGAGGASMRPRVIPAENVCLHAGAR